MADRSPGRAGGSSLARGAYQDFFTTRRRQGRIRPRAPPAALGCASPLWR